MAASHGSPTASAVDSTCDVTAPFADFKENPGNPAAESKKRSGEEAVGGKRGRESGVADKAVGGAPDIQDYFWQPTK
jgi:hypothetical protein